MSDLTPCNYCTLKRMQERAKRDGKKLTTKWEDGWIRVYEDGKKTGTSFMALTDRCVC